VKLLIDANLSPTWIAFLAGHRIDALHWTSVGDVRAPDEAIMEWARSRSHVVFTHDLDFGALLAITRARGPSVLQLRTHDTLPAAAGDLVVRAIRQHSGALDNGALVTVHPRAARVRILPIGSPEQDRTSRD